MGSFGNYVNKPVFIMMLVFPIFLGCDNPNNQKQSSNVSGSEDVFDRQENSHAAEDYSISASSELNEGELVLDIATNIPGTVEIMAGIGLSDQAPDDVLIGKNERVRLVDGVGQVVFDVNDLPAGQYDVEVNFYPRWGFQDEASKLSGIDKKVHSKHTIDLEGSGESAESTAKRNQDQKWVMENIIVGSDWKPEFWRGRFGQWREFPVKTRNPEIISNYYFESLDMTIIVNILKNEVVTWRMGKDGL